VIWETQYHRTLLFSWERDTKFGSN